MALTCIPHLENSGDVEGDKASAERSFTVIGTENESAAIGKASTVAPAFLTIGSGLARLSSWSVRIVADNTCVATAKYASEETDGNNDPAEKGKPPAQPGEWEFQGNPITRNLKLQFAKGTAKRAGAGGASTYNTFSNAIGWDGKKINGIEWPVGACQIQIKTYFRAHTLTVDKLKQYNDYIGYINSDDDWLGFYKAGEARFLGAALDQVIPYAGGWPSKPASALFTFDISPNGNVTVPGLYWDDSGTDTTEKKGWQYLDVYSETRFDANGIPIPVPKIANIRDIGPTTSFAEKFGWTAANKRGAGIPPPP
jgi:hypothetical protein